MKKVLIVVGVVILLLVVWLLTLPGKYNLERSVVINANQQEVFNKVADFTEWPVWSPWLIMEPNAEINYAGTAKTVGSQYDWKGELVGSGEMEITKINGLELVDYNLKFKEPYKSEAKVYFKLSSVGENKTMAAWGMSGKMPFFMRFMTKMMVNFIQMDYDRGLSMLKDYCETGKVLSKITYGEEVEIEEIEFIGIRHKVKMDEMGEIMQKDFADLQALFTDKGLVLAGSPMSVYYSMDFKTGVTDFATAFPVEENDDVKIPKKFIVDDIVNVDAFTVIHHGKYEHIGNAWSAGMQYTRTKKMKPDMKAVMWEEYTNDPRETNPKDYETIIYVPLK